LLAASADIVAGRRITGFITDGSLSAEQERELAVAPMVVSHGGIWEDRNVVIDRNFISSRHPRDIKFFTAAMCSYLWKGAKQSPFEAPPGS